MKHIVCTHPCGNGQMVGDEKIVTDQEWADLKELKAGIYSIWSLKRDISTDVAPKAPAPAPTPASDPVVETDPPTDSEPTTATETTEPSGEPNGDTPKTEAEPKPARRAAKSNG